MSQCRWLGARSGMPRSPQPLVAGKWKLTEEIATGSGDTRVWRATSRKGISVVMKILPLPPSRDVAAKRRAYFDDEVHCGRKLIHETIRKLIDAGEVEDGARFFYPNGFLYLVFEWIPY